MAESVDVDAFQQRLWGMFGVTFRCLFRSKPLDYHADHSRRDAGLPVLPLLTVFGKNEKANLSKAERYELAKLVAMLKSTAGN